MIDVTPNKIDSTKLYQKRYTQFRGVDFSTDATQVADNRSPHAVNLISDMAGFPEKRVGWRTLDSRINERINGMHYVVFKSGRLARFIHAGDNLYSWGSDNSLYSYAYEMNDQRSSSFVHNNRLYILDGKRIKVIFEDEENDTRISNLDFIAFVPTTTIGADHSGGGTAFEAVNLLTPKRINSFKSNGNDNGYCLDAQNIDSVSKVIVNGEEIHNYRVSLSEGKVTLDTAPADSGGIDNVVIHFSKTIEGYSDRINKCTICDFFGYNNNNRVFLSGNPDYPDYDWQSGLDDPTYFPDTGYTKIGSETSAIMGYLKQFDSQTIIKSDNNQDAEIFIRTAEMLEDGSVIFPVRQGVKGVGAVSKYAFASLKDDPLFLGREGVFGITSTAVQYERSIQNRSYFVNNQLVNEPNLSEAVATVWNGYYILVVNGKAYVADSRKASGQTDTGDISYEWYFWINIPARVIFEYAGELYFGTEDGRLCKFNTDISGMEKFNDDGEPIHARWSTKMDDFGTIVRRKTLTKKGCGVMIKPYTRSSVTVFVASDTSHETTIQRMNSAAMDILDFSDIDFTRFTFNTLDTPQVVPLNKKIKKFIVLQLIFENKELNEGFGIYGIQVQYAVGGYVK